MRKLVAIVGSAIFLLIAPGTVAGLVPYWISDWRFDPPFFGAEPIRWAGAALIALGLLPLLDSFRRFAVEGLGTPAPVAPPRRLIVTGYYRYVRNPMYVGVLAAIVGQALLFGNISLLAYAAVVWFFFHAFVVLYEEATLRRKFGADYDEYRRNVPRWLPRLRPWRV